MIKLGLKSVSMGFKQIKAWLTQFLQHRRADPLVSSCKSPPNSKKYTYRDHGNLAGFEPSVEGLLLESIGQRFAVFISGYG